MDLYSFSLALGAVGLGAMAVSGLGHHLHHGGHAPAGRGGARGPHGGHGAGQHGHGIHVGIAKVSRAFLTLLSPRVAFGLLVGFGAAGMVLRHVLGGPVLLAAGVGGAALFEFGLMRPIWNFTLRFASPPALTLESAVGDEAEAVSAFDARGQGLVALEVDGQIVQLLGTLTPDDLRAGVRIRAGDRLFVSDVDGERHRVTVSTARG